MCTLIIYRYDNKSCILVFVISNCLSKGYILHVLRKDLLSRKMYVYVRTVKLIKRWSYPTTTDQSQRH